MIVIACVDDNLGMLFHNRRQSRDRVAVEEIIRRVQAKTLYCNAYSAELFAGRIELKVSEDFLACAGEKDFCFVENTDILPYQDKITGVIIVKWNRVYPADMWWEFPLEGWKLKHRTEAVGYSHDKLTIEEYER